jgi:hypothetical protein
MALVVLILVMPYFYSIEVTDVSTRAAESELAEIADYTSNTLANLYFLANSTGDAGANLTKQLVYLPLTVHNSFYKLTIVSVSGSASRITASLRDNPSISADAWLVPGLKVGASSSIEVSNKTAIAGCYGDGSSYYVWLGASG